MGSYRLENVEGTVSSIEDAYSAIAELGEEMRSNADNMQGTNLEQTEKYTATEEAADTLEAISAPDVPDVISELAMSWSESINKRKGRGPSRDVRLGNAIAILHAAVEVAQSWAADNPDHDDHDDVEQFISDLEDTISDTENVEFPGMFG
jgi:hypothetical protein